MLEKVLLTPEGGESRAEFVARFMSDPDMQAEFPDESQRAAVANQQFGKAADPALTGLPTKAQAIFERMKTSAMREWRGPADEKAKAAELAAWTAVRSKFVQTPNGGWSELEQVKLANVLAGRQRARFQRVLGAKFVTSPAEAKRRITFSEIYVPWDIDAHGDFSDEYTIEHGAHAFMRKIRNIGDQHRQWGDKGMPVESFISREGDRDFPVPGSWIMGLEWSKETWAKILRGERTGLSMGGEWTRVPIVAGGAAEFIKGAKAESAVVQPRARTLYHLLDIDVDEVSVVDEPATRKHFRFFKGADVTQEKAGPASPWLKLYQQRIDEGDTPEKAREYTEMVLGPPPPGTLEEEEDKGAKQTAVPFDQCVSMVEASMGAGSGMKVCSIMQAKYGNPDGSGIALPDGVTVEQAASECAELAQAAGIIQLEQPPAEQAAIVKAIAGLLAPITKAIGKLVGGEPKATEGTKEDEAMTPQERQELDALKADVASMKTGIEEIKAALTRPPKADTPAATPPAAPAAAPAPAPAPKAEGAPAGEGGEAPWVPTAAETGEALIEIATAVKEIAERIEGMESAPGQSAQVIAMPARKDAGGDEPAEDAMVYSSVLGAYVPAEARKSVWEQSEKRLQEKYGDRRGTKRSKSGLAMRMR